MRRSQLLRGLSLCGAVCALFFTHGCSSASKSSAGSCSGEIFVSPDATEPFVGPFTTKSDYLAAWNGTSYAPLFLRGINLGRGVPGAFPTDFAITSDEYQRWLDRMGQMSVNLVRIYSLHPPAFYEALAAHNCAHPDQTIYLLQGVSLPSDPDTSSDATLDLHNQTDAFQASIDEAIDCVHGAKTIGARTGNAYGTYATDVSHWTLGFLIGREVIASEVLATDKLHPTETSFSGDALRISATNPTSAWVTAQLDHTVVSERTKYGTTRPVAFTNWLETDPLHHPTEGSASMEDVATIDTSKVVAVAAPAGVFASFHVYPYFPDFMSEDPGYQSYFSDEYGSDSYRGYLHDLKRYHGAMPVLVAEFGVPSSWGIAHYASNGMHQGGLTEQMQALYSQRMIRDIVAEKLAGSVYFAWMDEWFKTCWITNHISFPSDTFPKWHDVTNPQQFYGALSFDLAQPDYGKNPKTVGTGRVRSVETSADAEFFWTKLTFATPLADGESFTLGYDTYGDDVGETLLPNGMRAKRRAEVALTVTAPSTATLVVERAYDLYGGLVKMPYSLRRSVASDSGGWVASRRNTSAAHGSDDGEYKFPSVDQPIGSLKARRVDVPGTSLDAVVIDGNVVEMRVPWSLLQIADPTTFSAVNDAPDPMVNGAEVTTGIGLSVAIGTEVLETNRVLWPTWRGAPAYTEREKPVVDALAASYEGIATSPL